MNLEAPNTFKVEDHYQFYLRLSGADESKMHPIQRSEMRKAFYAGAGQILELLKNKVSELPEEKGVEVMESMMQEISEYFIGEVSKIKAASGVKDHLN